MEAYANSSWTLPSSISLFTSLYPSHHNIGTTMSNAVTNEVTTLPEHLKGLGYETVFVSTPQPNVGLRQGLLAGFSSTHETENTLENSLPAWLDAIDGIRDANKKNVPVFAYFHTDEVWSYAHDFLRRHDSFPLDPTYAFSDFPPIRFDEKLRKKTLEILLDEAVLRIALPGSSQYKTWYQSLREAPTLMEAERVFRSLPERIRLTSSAHYVAPSLDDTRHQEFVDLKRHVYDEHIRTTDLLLSEALTRMKSNALLDNTIVVITGEHGELLGEKGLTGHSVELHDRELHVPLIMHIPGSSPKIITDLTQLIDISPTILEVLGLPPKKTSDGISLAWCIRGDMFGSTNRYAISEWTFTDTVKSIFSDKWKLHMETDKRGNQFTLYDRTTDPDEALDVSRTYPRVVATMARAYKMILRKHPSYPVAVQPFPEWLDEELRKNLIETEYFSTP